MDKAYYSITEVCKMLDLKPYTIRYWETEFVWLRNKAKKGTARKYTEKDIEGLRQIKHLISEKRFTLEGAKAEIKRLRKEGEVADGGQQTADSEQQTAESVGDEPARPVEETEIHSSYEDANAIEQPIPPLEEEQDTPLSQRERGIDPSEEKSITWGELQKKFSAMSESGQKITQTRLSPDASDFDDPDDDFGGMMRAKPISTSAPVVSSVVAPVVTPIVTPSVSPVVTPVVTPAVTQSTITESKNEPTPEMMNLPRAEKIAQIKSELLEIKRILSKR